MNIDKQKLLEWLEQQPPQYKIIPTIQSGRFDSPKMEHEKAYWAREGLIKHQQTEIDRLRAALGDLIKIAKQVNEQSVCMKIAFAERIKSAEEALSTTTEPTGAQRVREIWNVPNANGSYHAGITRTLNALGITIPGINVPDKEDNA